MKGLVTNIQAGLFREAEESRIWSSVVIESTVRLEPQIAREPGALHVRIPRAPLNMPDCVIPAYDGILNFVRASADGGSSRIEVALQHDAPFVIERTEGMPHRLEIRFDSAPVYAVFEGRVIAIDAGHGGRDPGGRGPVNLLEKDVALTLATAMGDLCSNLGIAHFMTRQNDVSLALSERLELARSKPADMLLSVHTGVEKDRGLRGSSVAYMSPAGKELAGLIAGELSHRLNLPDRGVRRETSVPVRLSIPAVRIEFVTLTNPVDEGWVRSCTFMERAALAIINGAKNYLWRLRGGP